MKRRTDTPLLFIRDHDFEVLLGAGAVRELADARKDRASSWVCYDLSNDGSEPEKAATARLQCRYAHFHRIGSEACPACNTKQEGAPTGRPRPLKIEFVIPDKTATPEETLSALDRIHQDWE